ncbi:MAG: hypothetical protein P8020_14665 [Acidobacteriota bacterium]
MLRKTVVLSSVLVAVLAISLLSATPTVSQSLSAVEMSAVQGAGFWAGLACGAAFAGIAVAGAALAAPTAGMGTAVAVSVALHVSAVCLLS